MGYKPKQKIYNVTFEEGDLEGLALKFKSIPGSVLSNIMKMEASSEVGEISYILTGLSNIIIEWNVEDDNGNTMPISEESFESFDMDFILRLWEVCMDALLGVSGPLNQPSSTELDSATPEIPMETLKAV